MTYAEFEKTYKLVPLPGGEITRDDLHGTNKSSRQIWTVIDGDGETFAQSGYRLIDRIGFIVTKNEWTEEVCVEL